MVKAVSAVTEAVRIRAATTKRPAIGAVRLVMGLRTYEKIVLGLLLLAAWSPYGAPTGAALARPTLYTSIWSDRPFGLLNVFELGVVVAGIVYLPRIRRERLGSSSLDTHMLVFVALLAFVQLLALERNASLLAFQRVDTERVALVVATYGLVTRCRLRGPEIRLFTLALGVTLLIRFWTLVLEHGVFGSTEFGTPTGRLALVITEDVLLVGFALLLLWGLVADEIVSGWWGVAVVTMVGAVLLVDVLSLRRGALIFLGLCLLVRTFRAPRRVIVRALAVLAVGAAVAGALAGPENVYQQVSYAVRSTILTTSDDSTKQRSGEFENFRRNTGNGGDLLFGHGLGAVWNTYTPLPADIAAFGSKETSFVRVGWHVYGLDWLYKLGIVGVGLTLLVVAHAAVSIRSVVRSLRSAVLRSFAYSLGPITLVFLLFLFTNTRLAVFAGIGCALSSKIADGRLVAGQDAHEATPP